MPSATTSSRSWTSGEWIPGTSAATLLLTPVVLAALAPPEEPQIIFYRGQAAPDTTVTEDEVPVDDVRGCRVLWMSQGALALGATAESSFAWLELRGRSDDRDTVLDLDY